MDLKYNRNIYKFINYCLGLADLDDVKRNFIFNFAL